MKLRENAVDSTEKSVADAFSPFSEWASIPWKVLTENVKRLQMRIAKAVREGKWRKVKILQRLLSRSTSAKFLAVRRVVQNNGSKTPGIDNVLWKTDHQKLEAARSLKGKAYKAKPLRRIYIPKKGDKTKLRPLGIPTLFDRSMQALHKFTLEPVAESLADHHSYGFRPLRSTADAIEQCFKVLARGCSAQWILEGDIKSCFDKISHDWLQENIPMDKIILKKWLKAGYMEEGKSYPTEAGTPQGGIASCVLANMALDGLARVVEIAALKNQKVHFVRYCDDFIITGASKEILEQHIKPLVEAFLKDRGLELAQEKTKISHINDGFNFLGFNLRKYSGKLLIKPDKQNVKSILRSVREVIKSNKSVKTEDIINLLNPKIQGWAQYYKHVVAKETFDLIDHQIFQYLHKWVRRRHPNKNAQWCKKRYYRSCNLRNWIFSTSIKDKQGQKQTLDLYMMASTPIKRHIKIRAEAHPYDPKYKEYTWLRKAKQIVNRANGKSKELADLILRELRDL